MLADLKRGDFVIIQFGHNDAGALNEEPPGSTPPDPQPLKAKPAAAEAPAPTPTAAPAATTDATANEAAPSAAAATADAPAAGTLRINVVSEPSGARMFWKGKEVGTTPFTLEFPAGERHAYEIGLPGYTTRKVVIDGSKTEISIGLRPDLTAPAGAKH
jgi:serine/threonine-protein kinase